MNRYGLYLIVLLSNCSTIKAEQTIRLGMSVFESQGNVSKTFAGLISDTAKSALGNKSEIELVLIGKDREIALKEIKAQQSGILRDNSGIDAGNMKGAQKILRGKISRLSDAFYLSVQIIDVNSGVYEFASQYTICSEEDAMKNVSNFIDNVADKLIDKSVKLSNEYKECSGKDQLEARDTLESYINKSKVREVNVLHVSASSTLEEPGFNHSPWVLLDGVVETAWADGKKDSPAIGEWLFFSFNKGTSLKSLAIINGLGVTSGKWGNLFQKNASIKKMKVEYSNGASEIISLNNTPNLQYIPLKNAKEIHWLRLTIMSEYPGTKYMDTCISEIKFFGSNSLD